MYLTVDQLKTRVGVIPSILESEDNSKIEFLLEYCSLLINSYTQTHFYSEEAKTVLVDGDGDRKLYLPERIYNIRNLETYDGTIIYSKDYLVITDKNKSVLSRRYSFPSGELNIKLTGDFGWEEVPEDIIACLIALCNSNFGIMDDEDLLQKTAGPLQSEKIGNYSYQLRSKLNQVTGETVSSTGDLRVDQILDKYRVDHLGIEVI